MSYALVLLATLKKRKLMKNFRRKRKTINERIGISSYVVFVVINDDIEPAAGVQRLFSRGVFEGSLIGLRSIKDAIGSYRENEQVDQWRRKIPGNRTNLGRGGMIDGGRFASASPVETAGQQMKIEPFTHNKQDEKDRKH